MLPQICRSSVAAKLVACPVKFSVKFPRTFYPCRLAEVRVPRRGNRTLLNAINDSLKRLASSQVRRFPLNCTFRPSPLSTSEFPSESISPGGPLVSLLTRACGVISDSWIAKPSACRLAPLLSSVLFPADDSAIVEIARRWKIMRTIIRFD